MHELAVFDPAEASGLERVLREANQALAAQEKVPEKVRDVIREVAEAIVHTPREAPIAVDPYLIIAVQQGALQALLALEESGRDSRRDARVALERMRQGFRDLAEGHLVEEARPPKEIARWLAEVLEVSHRVIADVLGVSPRQLQRWISATERAQPKGDDALRIRVFARIVNNLRHVLTGPGVIRWMRTSHPLLKGESPQELLHRASEPDRLIKLSASARSAAAT